MLGQLDIWKRSQSITDLLASPQTPLPLKQQLKQILKIRSFATQVLHLPDNSSYTYYVDLQRPFVVWNVFAARPLALELKTWCFLIVGCLSYRGYFSPLAAQNLAAELRQQGYEVYVTGIIAYSTLGWLTDPVFNTFAKWPAPYLAGLMFHELAHQQLYLPNDTTFNESFATLVEEEGVKRWLAKFATPQEIIEYQQAHQRHQTFIAWVSTARDELAQLYLQRGLSQAQLQAQKEIIFARLREKYVESKRKSIEFASYDDWFRELNNAKLLAVVTYNDYVPVFQTLLAQQQGNLLAFYHAAAQFKQLTPPQRRLKLQEN